MIAQVTARTVGELDHITIEALENDWIYEAITELERRLRRESANMDAFDPLCGWLGEAREHVSVIERSFLERAFEDDQNLMAQTPSARAMWLHAVLEGDGAGALMNRDDIGRVYRILCRWAELRGIAL